MDNGPKDGDFASYVESLSRAHPIARAQHDADLALPHGYPDEHAAYDAEAARAGLDRPAKPAAAGEQPTVRRFAGTSGSDLEDPLRQIADVGDQLRRSVDIDKAALYRTGRRLAGLAGVILIAWGILATPLSIAQIIFGIVLLSLSGK